MPPFLTYLLRPVIFFAVTLFLFLAQRYCFVLFYPEIYMGMSEADHWGAMWHGLSMDCSMAGYMTIIPLLISMVCIWLREKSLTIKIKVAHATKPDAVLEMAGTESLMGHPIIRRIIIGYSIFAALLLSFIAILDAAIYPIWGFKLDMNPFYYFFTSPSTAIASMSAGQIIWGAIAILAVAIVWGAAYLLSWNLLYFKPIAKRLTRALTFGGLVLMAGLLFIVIRGGVTVSTMNLSRAYFSHDQRINHAAINPAFSLLSSATRSLSETDKYNFYPEAQLPELLSIVSTPDMEEKDWDADNPYINDSRPDIVLVILESFSSHLFPSLGGEPIAEKLDAEARKGLLFTNAYANGFRTDRGIPAILNAFPGLPDVGITKNTHALERLPSMGGELRKAGYQTAFYYGGDLNFTNMNALLVGGGFDNIVGDKDFPLSMRAAKWGVADHNLFKKVKEDMRDNFSRDPKFTVVQTSSSHEPFKVPFSKFANPAANAFAYTDSVVGDFMQDLRKSPNWKNTLVILVPDHYGAYPENLPDMEARHKIPIIFAGGALKQSGRDNVLMSQTDIAPTVLSLMGLDTHQFFFGRNVLDLRNPPMVFYYDREAAFLKSTEGEALLNTVTMDMTAKPSNTGVANTISPFNPATQLRGWIQAVANYYSPQ